MADRDIALVRDTKPDDEPGPANQTVDGLPYSCEVCGVAFETAQQKAGHVRTTGHRGKRSRAGEKRDRKRGGDNAEPEQALGAQPRAGSLKGELELTFTMIGNLWAIRDPQCGGMLKQQAGAMAAGLDDWARADEKVARWLASFAAPHWMGFALATMPLAITVQDHHLGPAARKRDLKKQGLVFDDASGLWYHQERNIFYDPDTDTVYPAEPIPPGEGDDGWGEPLAG